MLLPFTTRLTRRDKMVTFECQARFLQEALVPRPFTTPNKIYMLHVTKGQT